MTPPPIPARSDLARPGRPLLLAAGVYVGVHAAFLLHFDLWFDELFSLGLASSDWHHLFAAAAADQTNPPLFYALLKLWLLLGSAGPLWLRLLPGLLAAAAIWPLLRMLERAGIPLSERIAVVAVAAVAPTLVFQGAEVRSYGLLLLLSAASQATTVALATGPRSARRWQLLTGLNVALVLTHYYGWFTVAAEAVTLVILDRPDRKRLAISLAVTALCFAPWAAMVAAAAHGAGAVAPTLAWIGRPALLELVDAPVRLFGAWAWPSKVAMGAMLLIPATWIALRACRSPGERPGEFALALFALFPLLGGFIASWLLPRSIWNERYLIAIVVPLLALGFRGVAEAGGRRGLVAVTVLLVAIGGRSLLAAGSIKIPWQGITARMAATAPAGDSVTVFSFEGFTGLPVAYYARIEGYPVQVRPLTTTSLPQGPVWIIARDSAWPGHAVFGSLDRALRAQGWTVTDSVIAHAPQQRIEAYQAAPPTPSSPGARR